MSGLTLRLTLVSVLTISNQIYAQFNAAESEVEQFIRESESQLLSLQQAAKVAQWNYRTNITEETEAEKLKRDVSMTEYGLALSSCL